MKSLTNIDVVAISAAVPARQLEFHKLANEFGQKNIDRIVASTGIGSVRIAGSLSTGDLCEAAAKSLLASTEVAAADIDAVVVITQTPDDLMPGVAFKLQHKLGLRSNCLAFDINQGCAGYIYGLLQASMLVNAGCRQVLLCTGDVTSKLLDSDDRNVKMVFGDAASATLLKTGTGQMDFKFNTDGGGRCYLHTPIVYQDEEQRDGRIGRLHMGGKDIMDFALTRVPIVVNELLEQAGIDVDDLELVVFHQANKFMINYLQKLVGLNPNIVPVDMEAYGNTGPSSIPLLLANKANLISDRSEVLLCGFGIGLSVGAVRLNLSGTKFISPIDVFE